MLHYKVYIAWFLVNIQWLSAAGITSIIIISLLSFLQDLEITKHNYFPNSLISRKGWMHVDSNKPGFNFCNSPSPISTWLLRPWDYRVQTKADSCCADRCKDWLSTLENSARFLKRSCRIIQQSHSWARIWDRALIQKNTCPSMFIAALFTIAKTGNNLNAHWQMNG